MGRALCMWIAVVTFVAAPALAGPRDAQWEKVYDALDKGLPKTALAALEPILSDAMRDKADAEATKALGVKIALEASIEGGKPEERILRLQDEIARVRAPMKPPLQAILAHWYWQYFQNNRWRFLQRTQTAVAPGPDMQTWDLPRILATIDAHFKAALADEATLKATPISAWDALLVKGTVPDTARPTLFDFLVHEALSFYTAGEQGAVAAEDAFGVAAGGPIFASAAEFLKWRPETTEEGSPTLEAVRLYQKLLAFHAADADKTALLEADLERLIFGHNVATGENMDERYKAALKRFAAESAGHEISARALAEWAGVLQREGEHAEAHRVAQRGLDAFPQSAGGAMCFNLLQQIEAKQAAIQTESVWNEPFPDIQVTYRNITQVFFRAVAYDFEAFIRTQRRGWYNLDANQRSELLRRQPALEWNADLPPTADYQFRTEELPAPRGLPPGFYFIVASHDRAFGNEDNQISFAAVWVSDLALVMRRSSSAGEIEGFVLEARTGEPIAGAKIRSWSRDSDGELALIGETSTDRNGVFRLIGRWRWLLLAQHGRDRLGLLFDSRGGPAFDAGPRDRTVLFTDRSLYRPGQTIHYKGIRIRFDQTRNEYRVLAGDRVTVTFLDTNGKEIAQATHQCNDYGSFSGLFTAPRDRLAGRMSLHAANGGTSFSVEEYKRPKFQVELLAPKEAAKLEAQVVVPGRATSYTGAAIGGAKIRWHVMREVRFPTWWWGWRSFGAAGQRSQAIAHGTSFTDTDGSFTLEFNALPDRHVARNDEPIFEYHVHADVTDATGETRSAERVVRAGYTALRAALAAGEWQTHDEPVDLMITTTSLDGDPQPARGTVKLHRLEQPARVVRARLSRFRRRYWETPTARAVPNPDPSDPSSWDLGPVVNEKSFQTDATGRMTISVALETGVYRAILATTDRFDQPVRAQLQLHVVDPKARRFSTRVAHYFAAPQWKLEPGERFVALWGTGYDTGRAFVEIDHRGSRLQGYWTRAGRTQARVEQAVSESMRGGFTVRITFVRENRAYFDERFVDVPWSNKKLTVKWEHFRSRLDPGKKETWTATITGPDSGTAIAEMVAGLYDASLDQFLPHVWTRSFDVFRRERRRVYSSFTNTASGFRSILHTWRLDRRPVNVFYRTFPRDILAIQGFLHVRGGRSGEVSVRVGEIGVPPAHVALPVEAVAEAMALNAVGLAQGGSYGTAAALGHPQPKLDLGAVRARKNLDETAFFFPHLLSDQNGRVQMEFTMPEALTQWRFLGFAHDRQLRSGFLTDRAFTAKDLMVEPNPPRFVREGDVIEFTVKVSNQTSERQTGRVKLTLADARTLRPMDEALGNTNAEIDFDVPGHQSRGYSWRLSVPDGCDFLIYKAVGATAQLSDGEEGFLPVLSRRILVTESLPLPIRGMQAKQFEFPKLRACGESTTLRHQSLTVQMVSQPAWYAVMALPYLMEFPYECSEQIFNRLYANCLARHIAYSDPKIRRVFDQWKGTLALDSPLEKNQDLKALMLEETPWVQQAQAEGQARRNVGILFDANRLDEETRRALRRLSELQTAEGLWPWFPGGRPNEYIALYITTGFGRLRHLGVDVDMSAAVRSLRALDTWVDEQYRDILRHAHQDDNHLGHTIAFYLYGRSFFLKDQPVAEESRAAIDYWLGQARKYWLDLNCRQSQAHVALGLWRFGDQQTPRAILKSLEERSVRDDELGMFWRDLETSWWWYRAPIETQAMMIEAFAEVMGDSSAVENCKVWLLKQKQTRDWKTTKATADAIYALLLRGTKLLASDALVQVALGGKTIDPVKVDAGTGFYEQRFTRGEIRPDMGRVTVTKSDDGVSWGSLHWQYLEDMAKVTPDPGTPLSLKKQLFTKDTTRKGQVLKPVTGALEVGDELVVRIELRTDRDMEYVHLKDQRGCGTEPMNVLSSYRYQDGLAYYENTRDTASHFFIDYIPKGVYVFEYSTRIQHRGRYQTGVASIQCMYAPEFNSHSESFALDVE